MRFDINLASNPYQDAREFYRRYGTALGVVVVLTLALVGIAWHEWSSTRDVAAKIDEVHNAIAELDRQKAEAERILNLPENRGTRDGSQFVNQLITRKAFSWTQVFAQLEKLMPSQIHVVSISPELGSGDQLSMKIILAGESLDKAVELMHNLEKSPNFRDPRIEAQQADRANTGDAIDVEVSALYVPSSEGVVNAAAKSSAPAARHVRSSLPSKGKR
ncbi:MAG TPA: PilN domain-containing protein [Terriglobales bacterium]|nr:PilN domain-containing protein [Terriglobales bacterium]